MLLFIRRVLVITILFFLVVVLFRMFAPSKYESVKNYLKGEKSEIVENLSDTKKSIVTKNNQDVNLFTGVKQKNISTESKESTKDSTSKGKPNHDKLYEVIGEINKILDKKTNTQNKTDKINTQKLEITERPENKNNDISKKIETEVKNDDIGKDWVEKINSDIAQTEEGKALERLIEKSNDNQSDKEKNKLSHTKNEPVKIYVNNNSQNYTNVTQKKVVSSEGSNSSYTIVKTKNNTDKLSEYDRAITEHIFGTISE